MSEVNFSGSANAEIRRASLSLEQADHMVENVVATYSLPFSVIPNFQLNGRTIDIAMVTDDRDVVASCVRGARLALMGGGFTSESTEPIMIGQIQVLEVPDFEAAMQRVNEAAVDLIDWLNTHNPSTISRHSRAVGISLHMVTNVGATQTDAEIRATELISNSPFPAVLSVYEIPLIRMLIVHVHYNCADAMGANLINTACEALAPRIELLTGGRVNLCVLSNLSDQRRAYASCTIAAAQLPAAHRIAEAARLFQVDVAWALAHNKNVLDAIGGVVMATGNDWRAVEAGAHAFAARNGHYAPLARWYANTHGDLTGHIDLPLALGIIGGAIRVHPLAQMALRIMRVTSARQLAETIACVGLARSLADVCGAL